MSEKPNANEVNSDRPASKSWRAVTVFCVLVAAIFAGDLAMKALSFEHVAHVPVELTRPKAVDADIPMHAPVVVIPGYLSLLLTLNHGAVFGSFQGGKWLFIIVSVVAVGVIVRVFLRSSSTAIVLHIALALILAGALGNLYDRIVYSAVRDMLWMLPGRHLPMGLSWPNGQTQIWPWIFNVADAALVTGVTLVVGLSILGGSRQPRDGQKPPVQTPPTDAPARADSSAPSSAPGATANQPHTDASDR